MTATPSELCTHASREIHRIGPQPPTARECVRWREERDTAARSVAALADWDPVVLAQAALLAAAGDDDVTHALLREAGSWGRPA